MSWLYLVDKRSLLVHHVVSHGAIQSLAIDLEVVTLVVVLGVAEPALVAHQHLFTHRLTVCRCEMIAAFWLLTRTGLYHRYDTRTSSLSSLPGRQSAAVSRPRLHTLWLRLRLERRRCQQTRGQSPRLHAWRGPQVPSKSRRQQTSCHHWHKCRHMLRVPSPLHHPV